MSETEIHLFTIGFGRPDLLRHQKALLDKYLEDTHTLHLVDNSRDEAAVEMEAAAASLGVEYLISPSVKSEHHEALNYAASHVTRRGYPFFGFLDHDVFPRRPTTLIDKVEKAGFYGMGQTHPASGNQYLWPGFCFYSGAWLDGRQLDFGGIRGDNRRDDGDTGSASWPLFTDADWRDLYGIEHGYVALRMPDIGGLQSWGYEILGDWIHFTNASHWMVIRDPQERDRLLEEVLAEL